MRDDDRLYDWDTAEKDLMGDIDNTVPVSARIWNYWMGGKDYFQVDEEVGDRFLAQYPGIADLACAKRLFMIRSVTYLVREAGIRQFLDIGTGLPTRDNTHEVAQRIAPDSRVVYVDNDPLVLAHARALLTGTLPGTTDYIDADLNKPDEIMDVARDTLDFTRPVAVILMSVLGHIGDPEENDDAFARSVVERLKAALPAGSHLAIHESANTSPAYNEAIRIYNRSGAAPPYHLRRVRQIRRFFDGFDVVAPGIVPIQEWRPDKSSAAFPRDIPAWGGVAVKALGS